MAFDLAKLKFRIEGVTPFLMNAPTTLNPLHPLTKQIKAIVGLRGSAKEARRDELTRLEWEASLYW